MSKKIVVNSIVNATESVDNQLKQQLKQLDLIAQLESTRKTLKTLKTIQSDLYPVIQPLPTKIPNVKIESVKPKEKIALLGSTDDFIIEIPKDKLTAELIFNEYNLALERKEKRVLEDMAYESKRKAELNKKKELDAANDK